MLVSYHHYTACHAVISRTFFLFFDLLLLSTTPSMPDRTHIQSLVDATEWMMYKWKESWPKSIKGFVCLQHRLCAGDLASVSSSRDFLICWTSRYPDSKSCFVLSCSSAALAVCLDWLVAFALLVSLRFWGTTLSLFDLAGVFDVLGDGQDFVGVVASTLLCSTRPVFCIRLLICREAATVEPPCYV